MEEETEFFIDVVREENLQKLEEITRIVSEKPPTHDPNAIFLRKFLLATFIVTKERKKKKKEEIKGEKPLEKKEIAKKIEKEIKEVKLEVPKPIILQPAVMPKPQFPEYPLVVTKDTNKVLAKASLKDNHYYLDEPKLEQIDFEILTKLKNEIGKKLLRKPNITDDKKYLMSVMKSITDKFNVKLDDDYYEKLKYYLVRDVVGLGKIDAMLKDGNIKEIYCDGVNKTLYLTYNNEKIETDISYNNEKEIDDLIYKFSILTNKKLNSEPFLEVTFNNVTIKAIRGLGIVSSKFTINK